MDVFDYDKGIHPDCGVYDCFNDIIVTPFFTPEYCKVLVDFCKKHSYKFINTGEAYKDAYSNFSLFLNHISPMLFDSYARHFMSKLDPVITEVFIWNRNVSGFLVPFINRYNLDTQYDMDLHCDASSVSIIVKLNDDYDGGLLNFPRQKFVSTNLKVGEAVVFPGTVSHPHFVEPLHKGERFTLVGFTTPPAWNASEAILVT